MSDVLSRFFYGRSIAIIGASTDPTKLGGRPIRMNKELGYKGIVYPVHPTAALVQDLEAFNSIDQLPGDAVDCALIAVPQQHVKRTVIELARKRVPLAIILSSGFAEHSPEGASEQAEILEIAREVGMRIVGPNSMGGISYETASQSGFVGSHLMGLLRDRGLGIAKWLATGNQADIDISDVILHYAQDEITKIIVVYVEGINNADRLFTALDLARQRGKQVVALKVGRTEFGARAVASHTAALVGNADAYDAAFRRYGVMIAASLDDLADLVAALDTGRSIPGRELGIATVSGGFGILMSDIASANGMHLSELGAAEQEALKSYYALASSRNPVDMGSLPRMGPAIAALAKGAYQSIAIGIGHFGLIEAQISKFFKDLQSIRNSSPHLFLGLTGLFSDEWRARFQALGVFVCEDPSRLVRTMANLCQHAGSTPVNLDFASAVIPTFDPAELMAAVDEMAARSILRRCGIPVAEDLIATSALEAVQIAAEIGGKVVLKIASADIPHKTEVGGVLLGLAGADDVARGYEAIMSRVSLANPDAHLDGVLVSPMIADGSEILIGFTTDEVFGPMVAVALGGVVVEVLKDKVVEIAPFDKATALRMVSSLKGAALLDGFRGRPPVDVEAIADALHRVSLFAAKYADVVESLEINPLIARADGAIAVDALLIPKRSRT